MNEQLTQAEMDRLFIELLKSCKEIGKQIVGMK
jgi:hypothetical protein